jgi:hypothetical protein
VTRQTGVPPAYLTYRTVVSAVVVGLGVVAVLIVLGEYTGWWHSLLQWCRATQQAWIDLDWQAV